MRTFLSLASALLLSTSTAVASPGASAPHDPVRLAGVGWWPDQAPDDLWAFGPGYRVRFAPDAVRFEPALGSAAPRLEHLELALESLRRGDSPILTHPPARNAERLGDRALYRRPGGIEERWDLGLEGVEFSFLLPEAPAGAGDLVVRMALATSLTHSEPDGDGGVRFLCERGAGVRIGGVLGIDADGRTFAGELELADGGLELRLAESFVESARYPLLIDPLIGAVKPIAFNLFSEVEPQVAYIPGTDSYMVAWREAFSADVSDLRVRRVDRDGNPIGTAETWGSPGLSKFAPRLTSSPQHGIFGLAYTSRAQNGTQRVMLVTFDAATGDRQGIWTAHSVGAGFDQILEVDVAAYHSGAPQGLPRFLVLWRDTEANRIYARLMLPDAQNPSDIFGWGSTLITVAFDSASYEHTAPRLSSGAAANGRVLAVWLRREKLGFQHTTVRGRLLGMEGELLTSATQLVSGGTRIPSEPVVDGRGELWTVAWNQQASQFAPSQLAARPVRYSGSGPSVSLGPEVLVTSFAEGVARPALAFGPAKSWLAYRSVNTATNQLSLRVRGMDGGSCTPCEGPLTLGEGGAGLTAWVDVASTFGQAPDKGNRALAVWSSGPSTNGDVFARVLVNTSGGSGALANLGGGCGLGGTTAFPDAAAIGTNRYELRVQGLAPGSVLAFLLLGSPASPNLQCGSCQLMIWDSSLQVPVMAGQASAELPLPCLPQLVGSALDVQWLIVNPSVSPCPELQNLSMSNRRRITLGQ